jgi:hypothetical protein
MCSLCADRPGDAIVFKGQLSVVSGQWSVVSGSLSVADVQWFVVGCPSIVLPHESCRVRMRGREWTRQPERRTRSSTG